MFVLLKTHKRSSRMALLHFSTRCGNLRPLSSLRLKLAVRHTERAETQGKNRDVCLSHSLPLRERLSSSCAGWSGSQSHADLDPHFYLPRARPLCSRPAAFSPQHERKEEQIMVDNSPMSPFFHSYLSLPHTSYLALFLSSRLQFTSTCFCAHFEYEYKTTWMIFFFFLRKKGG